jgi:hypothetical protein
MITIPFVTFFLTEWDTGGSQNPVWANQISRMALPAYLFMVTLLATAIPSAIIVSVTHAAARGFRRTRGTDYAVIGAVVGIIASVALGMLVPTPLLALVVVASGHHGAAYRRFAGLEPLPLPEAVLATDPATPRRRARSRTTNSRRDHERLASARLSHRVRQRLSGEERVEIRDHAVLHRHVRFQRMAADMRRQHDVGQRRQRVRRMRLPLRRRRGPRRRWSGRSAPRSKACWSITEPREMLTT